MLLRRARWSACASLIVIAVLSLAACGASSSPTGTGSAPTAIPTTVPTATPAPPSGIVVTAPIVGVTMFSATNGWGTVQSSANPNLAGRIAYTLDAGHTWYDVTPTGLAVGSQDFAVVYPLSTTQAWAWVSTLGGASTTLYYTTDSGAHWSTSTVATGAVKQMDCIDSQHGWLAATPYGGAASQYPIYIWSTTDGGTTWTSDNTNAGVLSHAIGVSFVNATTGFATGFDVASGALLITKTTDAGHSWTAISLPLPSDYWLNGVQSVAEPPVFTNATTGVMVVLYPTHTSMRLAAYLTADAGTTWTLGPVINSPIAQGTGAVPFSVTASGEVFATATATDGSVTFYDLLVGASSWAPVATTNGNVLTGLSVLSFVDATHGWAVTKSGLIATTDGGMTWTVVYA